MKNVFLAHDYQMVKLIPWGRWILGLIFLLHTLNKVNKECQENYVTQKTFFFSTYKNSGMNLIAVPEERRDFSTENSLAYRRMFILFTLSWTWSCISYLYQSSKYSGSTLGWNPGSNGDATTPLVGRITNYGFDALTKIDERDPGPISI